MKRTIILAVGMLSLLVFTGPAQARQQLRGDAKAGLITDGLSFTFSKHGERPKILDTAPSDWDIAHCWNTYRSTARRNWALMYVTRSGNLNKRCGRDKMHSNGMYVLRLERWRVDGVSSLWWTPVSSFLAEPCTIGSYPGQPRLPLAVVNDLFGINCSRNPNGSWTLPL